VEPDTPPGWGVPVPSGRLEGARGPAPERLADPDPSHYEPAAESPAIVRPARVGAERLPIEPARTWPRPAPSLHFPLVTTTEYEPVPAVSPSSGQSQSATVVMKFGGTSVDGPDRLKAVARRVVAAHEGGLRVVGVLSAMGDTTDDLLRLAHELSPRPHPRELDMLISVGERISCALAAMVIHDLGQQAISLTGSQAGIVTDTVHGKARIVEVRARRVHEALDAGKIVLVAGFQGVSTNYDVTTLGRGASDLTAVALAGALGADACEIYTDVDGVFTADPRIVPTARKLHAVTYEEMLEMSASGAKVLQLRSVEFARNHDVKLHVRSTFSEADGTWVIEEDERMLEKAMISGVTHEREEAVYRVKGADAVALLNALAQSEVNVDTFIQIRDEIVFSAPVEDRDETTAALDRLGADRSEQPGLGKVSIVGAGMKSHPGIAARAFSALRALGIEPEFVSTSPIKIAFFVRSAGVERAVAALHEAFELGEPAAERAHA
jgi:aspartate kinase